MPSTQEYTKALTKSTVNFNRTRQKSMSQQQQQTPRPSFDEQFERIFGKPQPKE
jgi:hypothetical protein